MSEKRQEGDWDMKAIGQRLRKARELRGKTQRQMAKELETSASHLSSMEHGRVGTSNRTARLAAVVLNVSLDYLMGLTDDPRSSRDMLADLETQKHELEALKEAYKDGEFIAVSEVDTSAGAGAVVQDESVTGHVKFPYQWMRRRGLHAARCRIIRVTGDSMEPTLPNGSAVLVDLDRKHRQDGKVFVIRIGDDLVVKRIVRDPEAGWLLVSDNPDKRTWVTRPWPEDAAVIGEIKWVARSLP